MQQYEIFSIIFMLIAIVYIDMKKQAYVEIQSCLTLCDSMEFSRLEWWSG